MMSSVTDSGKFINLTLNNDTYLDTNGSNSFENPFDKLPVRIMFIVCYAVVFTLCICGNLMVLFAIGKSPRLRSMTNFLLANLAIADFCVGAFSVLPNLSTFLQPSWILGKAMCKIYYYIWNVSYISSIIILTVIAIERYIAILHPLKARHFMTNKRLIFVQVMTWFLSLVYNIPFLFFYDTISFSEHGKVYCYASYEHMESLKWLSLMNLVIWYVMPLLLIGTMYYQVARALWKTTVVSALRLQPYPDADDMSSCRNSTRMSNINNDSFSKRSPQNKEPPLIKPNEAICDKIPAPVSSSEGSQSSERSVFNFQGKRAFTLFRCLNKPEEISPHEGRCVLPSQNSEGNDSEMAIQLFSQREECSFSISSANSFRKSRYRQTYLSSSRRVARARKKVIRLLITVVVTFGICVLPHKMKVLNHYWNLFHLPHNVETILSPVSFIVLYLNSVLNPFLYAMFSTNFRRSFKEALPCIRQRRMRQGGNQHA